MREESPGSDIVAAIRSAEGLTDLVDRFDAESVHDAYFEAKDAWREAIRRRQEAASRPDELAGESVIFDGTTFHVHGVTHAGTDAEREYLRESIQSYLDRGAVIYCEQGIRSMYFAELGGVCEMDDYLWAMQQCEQLAGESHVQSLPESGLDGVLEDIAGVAAEFREATFSLIESGRGVYGERFEQALGDVAAEFLTDHADLATAQSYEAFQLSQAASEDPDRLHDLQQYYERAFLPQPLEREWLRRHDPELELVSHARNERMADYAVYHNQDATEVHLVVGAAHQPGVIYYLDQYQQGREVPTDFTPL
jgi:hypothetical protein